jgi:hypothetical protein
MAGINFIEDGEFTPPLKFRNEIIDHQKKSIEMKIYTIKHKVFKHDAYLGHVIVANSEDEVREIAKSKSADEGKDVWNAAIVEEHGDYTCQRTEPFILLSDFQAG